MRALALALAVLAACGSEKESGAPAHEVERAAVVSAAPAPEPEPPPPPVPAAAPGLYTLPAAPLETSLPVTQATYLVIAADGALSTGTTGKGAFPGQAIDRADVVAAFAPPASRASAPVDAGPPEEPPDGEAVTGLWGKLTRAVDTSAPLLLTDGTRPSNEVIEIVADLERAQLAVAAPGDPAARALAATLAYRAHEPLEASALHVPLVAIDRFATELAVARVNAGPQATVVVTVDPAVTAADLVAALLALQRAQVDRFVLTTSRLTWQGVPEPTYQPRAIDAADAVAIGDPVVAGPATPAAVRKQVTRRGGYLGVCYRRNTLHDPLLHVTLEVAFTIARTGRTARVQVAGPGTRALHGCVAAAIRTMTFPRARAPSRVTVPITLGVR